MFLIRVLKKSLEFFKSKNPELVQKRVYVKGGNGRGGHYRMQWVLPGAAGGVEDHPKQLDLFSGDVPVKAPAKAPSGGAQHTPEALASFKERVEREGEQYRTSREELAKKPIPPQAEWTEIDGVSVRRIPGSDYFAEPVSGRKDSKVFNVGTLTGGKILAQLKKDEVQPWLLAQYKNELEKRQGGLLDNDIAEDGSKFAHDGQEFTVKVENPRTPEVRTTIYQNGKETLSLEGMYAVSGLKKRLQETKKLRDTIAMVQGDYDKAKANARLADMTYAGEYLFSLKRQLKEKLEGVSGGEEELESRIGVNVSPPENDPKKDRQVSDILAMFGDFDEAEKNLSERWSSYPPEQKKENMNRLASYREYYMSGAYKEPKSVQEFGVWHVGQEVSFGTMNKVHGKIVKIESDGLIHLKRDTGEVQKIPAEKMHSGLNHASRQEQARMDNEAKAEAQKIKDDLKGFDGSMNSLHAGKARSHLLGSHIRTGDGKIVRAKEYIESLHEDGYIPIGQKTFTGKHGQPSTSYYAQKGDSYRPITATQHKYLEHLHSIGGTNQGPENPKKPSSAVKDSGSQEFPWFHKEHPEKYKALVSAVKSAVKKHPTDRSEAMSAGAKAISDYPQPNVRYKIVEEIVNRYFDGQAMKKSQETAADRLRARGILV